MIASAYLATHRVWRANLNGERLEDVTVALTRTGRVDHDQDRTYRRELELEVAATDPFRPLTTFLIPELVVRGDRGGEVVLPLGHFVVTEPTIALDGARRAVRVKARDITWLLDQHTYAEGYTIPAGVDSGAFARGVLLDFGILARNLAIPDSGVLTTSETVYDPGVPTWTVVGDALAMGGMTVPYLDTQLRLASRPYTSLAQVPPVATYSNRDPAYLGIVDGSITETPDYQRLRNRVVVVKSVPGQAPIAAVAEIADRSSPLHPANLQAEMKANAPVVLGMTVPDALVETQAAAQARADAILAERASVYRTLAITTLPDVAPGDSQVIALDVWQGGEQRYGGAWWQTGWSVKLGGPAVTIERQLNRLEVW